MLNRDRQLIDQPRESAILSPTELLFQMLGIARRHMLLIGASVALFLGLAVAYLLTTPPQFYAAATMIMDTRKADNLMNPAAAGGQETPLDNPTVESQVEVIKSESIALAVIRQLKLDEDPNFIRPSRLGSMLGSIRSYFADPVPVNDDLRLRATVGQFENRLTVRRIGVTFVFEIGFTSENPEQAAQIANAVADAYVNDQLEAKYQSAKRAGVWLQDRLKDLGDQAAEADRAVANFRASNNIVDTGGRLLSEQQMSEVNSQLSLARGAASEARARLDRVEHVIASDAPNWSLTDASSNEVIIKLRNQYLELSKREADLVNRLGPKHQAVINTRNDMIELKRSINDELRRIGEGYRSDYEIARARVQSLESSLKDAVSQSQESDQAQVRLRGLESAAQSYRALYDSFLQRYMESVQQQSFPLTEARIVTTATPPTKKSAPKFGTTLLGAILLGSMAGFGLAFLREATDKTLRTPADVESRLGVSCIASVPAVPALARRTGARSSEALREAVAKPISRFAEAIRAIKVAVDFFPSSRGPQIVGFVSSLPGEGKTTLAANFAELVAQSGSSVVLIDGDLRNPSLTRRLVGEQFTSVSAITSSEALQTFLRKTKDNRLDFLPAVKVEAGLSSNDILSSQAMTNLLQSLKEHYDYVIVDLPPLLPIIDTRASADMIDCFVFSVEWGETLIENAQRALEISSRIQRKTVGVVLNKVDQRSAKRYFEYEYSPSKSAYYG